jgi:DNA-binding transcriptional LysR family regulator
MRSPQTGRIRHWTLRDATGREIAAPLGETIVVNDPAAMREAALLGLGITMIAVPDVLPALEDGSLIRLLPGWYADAGAISLYFSSRKLMPGKTRVFVDWVSDAFKMQRFPERFAGSLGL